MLFLLDGALEVGFVDTTNKHFIEKLQVGTVLVPSNLFSTGITNRTLAKTIKTDVADITEIKAEFAPKA